MQIKLFQHNRTHVWSLGPYIPQIFPRHNLGTNLDHVSTILTQYKGLEYSVSKDSLYCWHCLVTGTVSTLWCNSTGKSNCVNVWGNAIPKLNKHWAPDSHHNTVEMQNSMQQIQKNPSLAVNARLEQQSIMIWMSLSEGVRARGLCYNWSLQLYSYLFVKDSNFEEMTSTVNLGIMGILKKYCNIFSILMKKIISFIRIQHLSHQRLRMSWFTLLQVKSARQLLIISIMVMLVEFLNHCWWKLLTLQRQNRWASIFNIAQRDPFQESGFESEDDDNDEKEYPAKCQKQMLRAQILYNTRWSGWVIVLKVIKMILIPLISSLKAIAEDTSQSKYMTEGPGLITSMSKFEVVVILFVMLYHSYYISAPSEKRSRIG